MSRNSSVIVHADADVLAKAVAARLLNRLADVQALRGEASVVLTGGRIAAKVYGCVLASPIRDVVDWNRVDFWWGDERFLPGGDPERNETQAREAFLDHLPIDEDRVHTMDASDAVDSPEEAAALYAADLGEDTSFDLLLLGIGEDGHVASLFPGNPGLDVTDAAAVGVHDSPKPPSDRVSLTMPLINAAQAVWIIASGEGKADAIEAALSGPELPAGRVQAQGHTHWLVDEAAAARLKRFEF